MHAAVVQKTIERGWYVLGGVCAAALLFVSCAPTTEVTVKGDRSVVQVAAGALKNASGDARAFFILRDPDTGVDYLAVVDAGIIKLEPKSRPRNAVEQVRE